MFEFCPGYIFCQIQVAKDLNLIYCSINIQKVILDLTLVYQGNSILGKFLNALKGLIWNYRQQKWML